MNWGISHFMFCSWEIWKERCQALFKDLQPSPHLVLSRANSLLMEYSQAKDLATSAPAYEVVLPPECTGPRHSLLSSKLISMVHRRPSLVWVELEWSYEIIMDLLLAPLYSPVISLLRRNVKPMLQ
ncbi:uncharacterized protein Pyn_36625 [Prunus yedoensis var. nudiflora]|uniref:Uncharacterized protein n=1 Tax=Prunus yedoensis var. nudiflora TaxID=2094558 RepID=A0A314Z886_PRUYE|nr:uncharacterized protein Pyn_36625 [Prunus yedoensis var. nudiflora]